MLLEELRGLAEYNGSKQAVQLWKVRKALKRWPHPRLPRWATVNYESHVKLLFFKSFCSWCKYSIELLTFLQAFRIPLGAVGYYIVAKFTPMAPDGESGEPAYTMSESAVESKYISLLFWLINNQVFHVCSNGTCLLTFLWVPSPNRCYLLTDVWNSHSSSPELEFLVYYWWIHWRWNLDSILWLHWWSWRKKYLWLVSSWGMDSCVLYVNCQELNYLAKEKLYIMLSFVYM